MLSCALRAYEELESLFNWEQFVKVCIELKRKRGW